MNNVRHARPRRQAENARCAKSPESRRPDRLQAAHEVQKLADEQAGEG